MNPACRAFVIALLVMVAVPTPEAETQPAAATSDVIISGCVTQVQRTGSLADDSGAGVRATPNTAATEANNAEPVNAYLLTNASTAGRTEHERAVPRSYTLQGHEQELAQHLGRHVEVAGRLLPARTAGTPDTKATAPGIERIAVQTVKMLTSECPAKPR